MQTYHYRNATPKDKAQFMQLGTLAYSEFIPFITEENWERMYGTINSDDTWDGIIAQSTGFVCEDGDEIIGMAFLLPHGNPWFIFESEWSYIRMVGVHPRYAGQGIGKKLTQMCVDHARAIGEKCVALHTSEKMHAARHIYEGMGFKVIQELEPRFGLTYWLYMLEL